MTQTRRIILNVLATYGRSLFTLACGLFTGRWLLEALGTNRYGVFGVVGVILGLVGTVNSILSASVGRYFAFAVGKVQSAADKSAAIEESCGWFNTALAIHTAFAIILMILGYPLGFWAIRYYFSIPPEMVESALWVFSFSMITTFCGMITVPFTSLYGSHQLIAELTVYGICGTAANVVFAWVLLSYPGDRLWFNGFYTMLIAVTPNLVIAVRSFWVFPECRVRFRLMLNLARYKNLFSFAGWQIVAWLGLIARFQGLTTLCNKVLGLTYNSSLAVSNTLSQHTMTFAYAMNGAFSPAITNAAGAGDRSLVEALVLRSCKFGTIMCAVFIFPLCLEIHYVVHLWLKTVPPCVEELCVITVLTYVIERSATGYGCAISAYGDVKWMEIAVCLIWLFSLFLGWVFLCPMQMGVTGIAWAIFICTILWSASYLGLAKIQLHMKLLRWLTSFIIPFTAVSLLSVGIGWGVRAFLHESFLRLMITSIVTSGLFMVGCLRFVCDAHERQYLQQQLLAKLPFLRRTRNAV